jgi:hypothetical protein
MNISASALTYPLALLGVCSRKYFYKQILVTKGIFWSNYWKEWHVNNYWCLLQSYDVVDNPNKANVVYTYDSNSNQVLIVSQSLVEDGRLKLEEYRAVMILLKQNLCDNNLTGLVRLHPRQSSAVITLFKDLGWTIADSNRRFSISFCIGSYSSILPSIAALGIPVTIINFDNTKIAEHFICLDPVSITSGNEFRLNKFIAKKEDLRWYWGINDE